MTSFYSTEAGEYAVLNPYLLMGDFASGAMGSSLLAGYESLNPGPFMQIDEGTLGAQLFGGLSPNELKWRARAQDALMGGETPRISEKAQAAWEMVGGGFRTSPDTDAPNPPGFTDGAAGGKVEGELGTAKWTYVKAPLLNESSCTDVQLGEYLTNTAGTEAAEVYRTTGKWPSGVQIPKSEDVLTPDGNINWNKAPHGGYILDKNGEAIREAHMLPGLPPRFCPEYSRHAALYSS